MRKPKNSREKFVDCTLFDEKFLWFKVNTKNINKSTTKFLHVRYNPIIKTTYYNTLCKYMSQQPLNEIL